MFADYAMMGAIDDAARAQELAPLYVIMMWVTIGNGLRYGPRYLIARGRPRAAFRSSRSS